MERHQLRALPLWRVEEQAVLRWLAPPRRIRGGRQLTSGAVPEGAFQTGLLRSPFQPEGLALSRTGVDLDAGLFFTFSRVLGWRLASGPDVGDTLATHAHHAGGFVQYTAISAAGTGLNVEREFGRHRLKMTAVTPLAGYLVRPPYAMESNELWREGTSTLGVLAAGGFPLVADVQRATIAGGCSA